MMYKSCIFDLDGTLTDTLESLTYSVNLTMKEMGLPGITKEQCRMFVGNGSKVLLEHSLRAGSEQAITRLEEAMEIYARVFDQNCMYQVMPYPGIEQVLHTLQANQILIGVASNKYQAATSKLIAQYFPDIQFVEVLGQREGVPAKPDPQAVLEIMEKADVSREDVAYIGDSCVDMETGKNAGVTTIGASWGFRPRTELEAYNPDFIADEACDILRFLGIPEE